LGRRQIVGKVRSKQRDHLLHQSGAYEGDPKKNPVLYNELAAAYGEGPVAKLTADYQAFVGKPESNESKLVKAT
jgi:hypothetical protein